MRYQLRSHRPDLLADRAFRLPARITRLCACDGRLGLGHCDLNHSVMCAATTALAGELKQGTTSWTSQTRDLRATELLFTEAGSMTLHRNGPGVGLVAVSLILVAACSVGPGAAKGSAAPGSVTPSQTVDCLVVSGIGGESAGLDRLRVDATNIVLGTLRGFGRATWTSADGHRPSRQEVQQEGITLVTPADVAPLVALRGPQAAVDRAVIRGGTSGCDTVSFEGDPQLAPGGRYLFLMVPMIDGDGKPTDDLLVLAAWAVDQSDIVSTSEGRMKLSAVMDALEHGLPTIPPQRPGEPTDGPLG